MIPEQISQSAENEKLTDQVGKPYYSRNDQNQFFRIDWIRGEIVPKSRNCELILNDEKELHENRSDSV